MTIHEFGKGNEKTVFLLHPSAVMWDYFEYVIPLMKDKYHLVVPALPGYDPQQPGDFTSVEEIAGELADWLAANGIGRVSCIYGCSMGGAVVARFLADNRVVADSAVMDVRTVVCFASEENANAFVTTLSAYGYGVTGWRYIDGTEAETDALPGEGVEETEEMPDEAE